MNFWMLANSKIVKGFQLEFKQFTNQKYELSPEISLKIILVSKTNQDVQNACVFAPLRAKNVRATKTYFDKTNCGRSWKSEKIVYKCNTEFKLNLPDLPRIITYSRKCPIIHTGVTGQSLTNFEKFDKFSKCDRFDYQCCQKLIKH